MATRCKFCGTYNPIYCKGSGPTSVGRCHWEGMLTGIRRIHKELTTGDTVHRAYRAEEVVNEIMTKWEIEP